MQEDNEENVLVKWVSEGKGTSGRKKKGGALCKCDEGTAGERLGPAVLGLKECHERKRWKKTRNEYAEAKGNLQQVEGDREGVANLWWHRTCHGLK